jgi:hypothetical protein
MGLSARVDVMSRTDPASVELIQSFRTVLPNDSQTAIVIDSGAPAEVVRLFACSEGFTDLADGLFKILGDTAVRDRANP